MCLCASACVHVSMAVRMYNVWAVYVRMRDKEGKVSVRELVIVYDGHQKKQIARTVRNHKN